MAASLNSLLSMFLSAPGTVSFIAQPKHNMHMSANETSVANPQITKTPIPGTEIKIAMAVGTIPLMTDKVRYKKMMLNFVTAYSSKISTRSEQTHL